MASGLYIDARQLQKGAKGFERLTKEFPEKVSKVLDASALEVVRIAKRNAPADRGQIRQGISVEKSNPLQKIITSQAPYSAYMEFGTGKYAAQYVSSLPPDYQTYAAQFKGKSGGDSFITFVFRIAEWIRRKGIGATYSTGIVKNKRGGGHRLDLTKAMTPRKRNLRGDALMSLAYVIARSIYINGSHPQPFLIPALIERQPKLMQDMFTLINKLKIV